MKIKRQVKVQGETGHLEQQVKQAWRFTGNELKYIQEVLASGSLSARHGKMADRFEKLFAKTMGTKYAIALNSGTSTLHCAVAAAGVGYGDEVIVPALTIVCTGAAVIHHNGTPVFADSDRRTYNIDPADIARKITPRTKAIIVVPLAGLPCDMDPIMALAKKHNLRVIEDSAQSMLSTYKGRNVGTIGDCGSFSFEQTKHITTGDGGMLVTNDAEFGRQMRQLGCHGTRSVTAESGIWKGALVHDYIGWNYRLPETCSAVGLAQLERLEDFINLRKKIAGYYNEFIKKIDWLKPQYIPQDCTHSYYSYMLTFEGESELDKASAVLQKLDSELAAVGFKGGAFARPIYMEPGIAFNRCYGQDAYGTSIPADSAMWVPEEKNKYSGSCPVAEEIWLRSYNIPLFEDEKSMTENFEKFEKVIRGFSGKQG